MGSSRKLIVSLGLDRLFVEIVGAALSNYGWRVLDPEQGVSTPDVEAETVLVAGSGPVQTVIDRLRQARAQYPASKIVVLGGGVTDADVVRFIEEGASGWVALSEGLVDLIQVLKMLQNNGTSSSGRITRLVIDAIRRRSENPHPTPETCLTLREQEILRLIQDGLSNKEIANRLRITSNTVKNHVHHLLEKLRVRNRHEAAWLPTRPGTASREARTGSDE